MQQAQITPNDLIVDPILAKQVEEALRKLEKFHEIYEESPSDMAHWRTRPGRHPLESRSKYDGKGNLKVAK